MQFRAVSVLLTFAAVSAVGAEHPGLEQQFEQTVRPFVMKYCVGCHSGKMPAAQFDLIVHIRGYGDPGFSSLDASDGEIEGGRNATEAHAFPTA